MNIIDEEKIKLASPVPWLVFDEAVVFLLILICATFYYTYNAFANVKKEQTISNTIITESRINAITANDLSLYLDGVAQIICLSNNGRLSGGSGVLWKSKDLSTQTGYKYNILTNYHVISDTKKCVISIDDTDNKNSGLFDVEINTSTNNQDKDMAILNIGKSLSDKNKNISDYNYNLSSLRKCLSNTLVGSPVAIIGYPSYTKRSTTINIEGLGDVSTIYRATTNGIVSGYDTSLLKLTNNLSNENYFISAKTDVGNSGGIALSKDEQGLCVLGLPTWVTVGNYETQGLVQNIANIVP